MIWIFFNTKPHSPTPQSSSRGTKGGPQFKELVFQHRHRMCHIPFGTWAWSLSFCGFVWLILASKSPSSKKHKIPRSGHDESAMSSHRSPEKKKKNIFQDTAIFVDRPRDRGNESVLLRLSAMPAVYWENSSIDRDVLMGSEVLNPFWEDMKTMPQTGRS